MDVRVRVIAILVLTNFLVSDARDIAPLEVSGLENAGGPIDICTLCEDYTKEALRYLSQDKTQIQIMESLHKACLELHGLANQCTMLVNYYIPMFFSQVSSIQPDGFCKKVRLCKNAMLSTLSENKTSCEFCRKAMDDALEKLKDPNTELDVIQVLLKACDAIGGYSTKCKSVVFEFGPIILIDAKKFIENVDLCTTFHACPLKIFKTQQESLEGKFKLVPLKNFE